MNRLERSDGELVPDLDPDLAVSDAHLDEAYREVAAHLARRRPGALVLGLGRAKSWSGALRTAGWLVLGDESVDVFEPSPDIALVWLDDGGQAPPARRTLLADALARLHPGGVMVVVGYVVTRSGGRANPSMSQLVDDLFEASGAMVHVDVLQSIRWQREDLTRGVMLVVTSLAGGRDPG